MTIVDFEFSHPSGLCISRRLKDTELISVLPEVETSKTDMRNGWVWYRLPPFLDGESVVAISLGFNSGVLQFVTLADANTKFGAGWSEWSEEKEHRRAASIASWLSNGDVPKIVEG